MASRHAYYLTPTARRHLREARAWSIARWGETIAEEYFSALEQAAADLARNPARFQTRAELAGGTGLQLHPVREHFLVYEPLSGNRVIIVDVLHQRRNVPATLRRGWRTLGRELEILKKAIEDRTTPE